jgi:alkanesulfonate monooxygenase SsuD/methylene tetrahydromethanopterin reductase-like flavin-dependent oxidoreductase (luciferase family)
MAPGLKFAVRIHQDGWRYPELETVWQESERLGYDGASLYDVLGSSGPECWTALTALTAATRRIAAIPLVLANPYRHPAVLAKMAATLDSISGGRLILGLGSGGAPAEAAAFGIPWPAARERLAALGEAIEVMRLLWRGGGSYPGRWFRLDEASGYPDTARPGGPPVLIGGHGAGLLRVAAQHADLCNVGFDLPAAEWRGLAERLSPIARAAGRDPGPPAFAHNATVLLATDEAQLTRQVAAWAARHGLTERAARGRLEHSLAGTPEQVRRRLRGLEQAGVRWVFLLFEDLPRLAGLRLFAERVMPEFRTGLGDGTGARLAF